MFIGILIKNELSGELNVLKHALRKLNREDTNINHLEGLLKHELRSYQPSIAAFNPEHNGMCLCPGNKAKLLSLMKNKQISINDLRLYKFENSHSNRCYGDGKDHTAKAKRRM